MKRYVLAGLVLAVLTTLAVGTSVLGPDVGPVVLLGTALGGALGFAPGGSVAARAAGFLVGALLTWAGYLVRAAVLPDSAAGRAVAALAVLGLGVLVVAAARGRLAPWSLLLGVAAVAGAYERVYAADPAAVTTTSVETVTGVLLAAAVGLVATAFLAPAAETADAAPAETRPQPAPPAAEDDTTPVHGVPAVAESRAHPVFSPAAQPATPHPHHQQEA